MPRNALQITVASSWTGPLGFAAARGSAPLVDCQYPQSAETICIPVAVRQKTSRYAASRGAHKSLSIRCSTARLLPSAPMPRSVSGSTTLLGYTLASSERHSSLPPPGPLPALGSQQPVLGPHSISPPAVGWSPHQFV